jgi:hypothetical protein
MHITLFCFGFLIYKGPPVITDDFSKYIVPELKTNKSVLTKTGSRRVVNNCVVGVASLIVLVRGQLDRISEIVCELGIFKNQH